MSKLNVDQKTIKDLFQNKKADWGGDESWWISLKQNYDNFFFVRLNSGKY